MKISAFNLSQINRSFLNQPPLKCECKECEPGMYFECSLCELLQPWCMGAADDRPEICDECFEAIEEVESAIIGGAA